MRKMFWPLLTVAVFMAVMIIWFGAGRAERQLSNELAVLITQNNWFSYDVKGRNVILRGLAPDANTRDRIIATVRSMKNVGRVSSEIVLPKQNGEGSITIIIDDDSVILRGTIPATIDRFALINAVESKKPGMMVYDEMDSGTASNEPFARQIYAIADILPEIKNGVLQLVDNHLRVDADTLAIVKNLHALPDGVILDSECLWKKQQNEGWNNGCDPAR